jgi:hypothetical protein
MAEQPIDVTVLSPASLSGKLSTESAPVAGKPVALKPGWTTSEFIVTILAVIVGCLDAGIAGDVGTKISGLIVAGAAVFGFTISRGLAKLGFHMTKTLVFGVGLAVVLGASSGCACTSEAHRNDVACVVVHDIVDCTENAAVAVWPQFLPVVGALVDALTGGDGTVDWGTVTTALISLGIRDGGCILAALQGQYASAAKPGASPKLMRKAQTYHEGFEAYRRQRWPNVRFKLADGSTQ